MNVGSLFNHLPVGGHLDRFQFGDRKLLSTFTYRLCEHRFDRGTRRLLWSSSKKTQFAPHSVLLWSFFSAFALMLIGFGGESVLRVNPLPPPTR